MGLLVFDGVFGASACQALHTACQSRGLGHALYERDRRPTSALESAMESYLVELGDEAPFVEYWSRQEWRHIEAHADVDERLAADGGKLRFPDHGHVAYLHVGPKVRGPTCVWEPAGGAQFGGAMTAVPARAGRVLRFEGSLQHAVPKPADVWLAPFVISQSGTADDFVRSVVLFNTWTERPFGVEAEPSATDADPSTVAAAPRAEWTPAKMQQAHHDLQRPARMKLWLLGDEKRRQQAERNLVLDVDGDAVLAALTESEACTELVPPPRASTSR